MTSFNDLGLSQETITKLNNIGFKTPTPIQEKSIPEILNNKDILGSAQTGTGKTGAFGIPLIDKLSSGKIRAALVIAPTRELAMQVQKTLQSFAGKNAKFKDVLLIGGESISQQYFKLKQKPRLIVGTPGRINDHIERGNIDLSIIDYLVLDETDRMLDMGFSEQIDAILELTPKTRQTLLFSATLPKNIIKIADKYLNNPLRLAAGVENQISANLKQEILHLSESEKYGKLVTELESRDGSVIVFVKTKMSADKISSRLKDNNLEASAIHGDLHHNKRLRVIEGFRKKKHRILVATDIAARGLDISHVEHVINYDLPQCPEDYIHRIGRTARAGAEGSSLCFISPADKGKWRDIERILNPDAYKNQRSEGSRSGRSDGSRTDGGRKKDGFRKDKKKFGNSSNDRKPKKFGKKPKFFGSKAA